MRDPDPDNAGARPAPGCIFRRIDGVEANARLTGATAALLLVLLAAEGATIPFIGPLLTAHVLIGMILVPPLLVKIGATGYRFVRYYRGDAAYRQKGPPPALLRLLGPLVVVLTVVVMATGIVLLFAGPHWRPVLLLLHRASFILWFGAMTVHVLGHLADTARLAPLDWYGRARRDIAGAGKRQWLLVASLVLGILLAVAVTGRVGSYRISRDHSHQRAVPALAGAPARGSAAEAVQPARSDSTTSTTSTTEPVTTTTIPSSFGVGLRTLTFTDRARETLNYATSPPTELSPERTITTEIRYPISATQRTLTQEMPAAAPAAGGPFPVIVFAHGYAVMPDTYRLLLDAWVRAGFVVVSPVFPVTNYYEWLRQGGGAAPEDDVGYQPYDVAFVVGELLALSAKPGSFLHGLVDLDRLGLAGQSDGATTIAGLAYARYYATRFAAMPVHPLALAILSGAQFQGAGTYSDPLHGPAFLSVESDDDYCNPTQQATALYDAVASGAQAHWFLTLEGADHSGPYFGLQPWAAVVQKVTTGFFELELRARHRPVTPADLAGAGDVSGVATLSGAAEVRLAPTSASGECGTPSPFPPRALS